MCHRHSSSQYTNKTALQKGKQGTYKATLWRVRVTFFFCGGKTTMHSVCFCDTRHCQLYKNTVTQQCFMVNLCRRQQ